LCLTILPSSDDQKQLRCAVLRSKITFSSSEKLSLPTHASSITYGYEHRVQPTLGNPALPPPKYIHHRDNHYDSSSAINTNCRSLSNKHSSSYSISTLVMNDQLMTESFGEAISDITETSTKTSGTSSTKTSSQQQKRPRTQKKVGPRTNKSLTKATQGVNKVASAPLREVWIVLSVRRKPTSNQWRHQTSTMVISSLLNSLNDGDKANRTPHFQLMAPPAPPSRKATTSKRIVYFVILPTLVASQIPTFKLMPSSSLPTPMKSSTNDSSIFARLKGLDSH
jgi:hypothetical protein